MHKFIAFLAVSLLALRRSLAATAGSEGGTIIPDSKEGVDPFMPPARHMAWLYTTEDGLHVNVEVLLGTPGQRLRLIVDTGSSDMLEFNRSLCEERKSRASSCFLPSKSSSTIPPDVRTAAVHRFGLNIDGESVSDFARAISEVSSLNVFRVGQSGTLGPSPSLRTVSLLSSTMVFSSQSPIRFHRFNYSDGILGAAYNALVSGQVGQSPFLSMLGSVLPDQPALVPIFAIDMKSTIHGRPQGATGTLDIGGIQERFRDKIQWSSPGSSSGGFHEFMLYDLSICGAQLFTPSSTTSASSAARTGSGFHPAIVDTGASCLTLPAEFFDMVMSWIPVECDVTSKYCNLPCGSRVSSECTFPQQLPTLNFRMSQTGPLLHIPLSDLLLPPNSQTGLYRYCIVRGPSLNDRSVSEFSLRISFGSRVLRSLYSVFDMQFRQVGFANPPVVRESRVQCRVTKQCVGMQTRYPPLNTCQDPPCSEYYFFSLDNETKTCKLTASFHALAAILITLLIGAELVMNEIRQRLAGKVMREVQAT